MTDADKILQAVEELKSGQQAIKEDLKSLKEGQRIQELKAEVFHTEQTKAHEEIIQHLLDVSDAIEEDHKSLEKRVERIEKHLNLPPVK